MIGIDEAREIVKAINTKPLTEIEKLRTVCVERMKLRGPFEDIMNLQFWKTMKCLAQQEISKRKKIIKRYKTL